MLCAPSSGHSDTIHHRIARPVAFCAPFSAIVRPVADGPQRPERVEDVEPPESVQHFLNEYSVPLISAVLNPGMHGPPLIEAQRTIEDEIRGFIAQLKEVIEARQETIEELEAQIGEMEQTIAVQAAEIAAMQRHIAALQRRG